MKLILLTDIDRLGKRGDKIEVAKGYGRNYLIPKGLALTLTSGNLKKFEHEEEKLRYDVEKTKREAERLKEKLKKLSLTIAVQAGEDDKLFGAVTNMDIEQALSREGYNIDRKKIKLEEPIKELGVYTIKMALHPEVEAELKLWVVSK